MPTEKNSYTDPLTGVEVTRLTRYKGHSHHFYFTNPGWYDRGRRLYFSSDRDNRTNLFGVELASGEIEQLTDFRPKESDEPVCFLSACVNPKDDRVCFRADNKLFSLDPVTRELSELYRFDPDWHLHMINCSADGKYYYFAVFLDADLRIRRGLNRGEITSLEVWELKPLSRIVRVPAGGGAAETVREEKCWIGHVNTSPTRPGLLTFCHEGPWHKVDHRIWVMNLDTGVAEPIRPTGAGEKVGHEYWYADGVRIGYHGNWDVNRPLLGRINFDNTGEFNAAFPGPGQSGHIFSLDEKLIAGDGDGMIKLWIWDEDHYQPPRVLCRHNSGMRIQETHPHPRISPDGSYLVYTTDGFGYGTICTVRLDDPGSLPFFRE